MCASKEYLFEVGGRRVCVSGIHLDFVLIDRSRIAIVFDVEGRDKLDTVLIESQRMAEVTDGTIRTAEW